jgi:DNA polymerase-1
MNTLLIIDGNAIMHRAYHALPPFHTKDGTPTQVVYGFFSILHKTLIDFHPTHLIVCFDLAAPTFRKKLFQEYKAQRKKLEDDFIVQIPLIKEGLTKAQIVYAEKPGFEADDLIGTLSKDFPKKPEDKVLILSGDKDILQLVNPQVLVITPQIGFSKMKIYTPEEVKNTYSVTPTQMADYKALTGDQSDNYSGAKGIGPKTAALLINQFQTVENIFNHLETIKPKKLQEILLTNKNNILMAKQLSTIITNIKDLKVDKQKTVVKPLPDEFKNFLLKYEIYSLIRRFFNNNSPAKITTSKLKNNEQIGLFQ